MIGVLQALETIKILIHSPFVLSKRFLIFDGIASTFQNIKLKQRNIKCEVCGDAPTITSLIDYEQFCGSSAHDKVGIRLKKYILDLNQLYKLIIIFR